VNILKNSIRKFFAVGLSLLGTVMTVYVSLYLLLFCPLYDIYIHFVGATLTAKIIFVDLIKVFVSSTVGGAVWVVFDLAAGFFRDEKRED